MSATMCARCWGMPQSRRGNPCPPPSGGGKGTLANRVRRQRAQYRGRRVERLYPSAHLRPLQRLCRSRPAILNAIDEGIHVVNKHGRTVFLQSCHGQTRRRHGLQPGAAQVLAYVSLLTPQTSTILRSAENPGTHLRPGADLFQPQRPAHNFGEQHHSPVERRQIHRAWWNWPRM